MVELESFIKLGLRFIATQQRTDGGFDGLASADSQSFRKPRQHPTIFFTALISQCCQGLAGSELITKKATDFLLAHKSTVWSWNYWQRDEAGAQMRGYPDDLDDTACALAAIISQDSSQLDGAVLGHIGRQLVASETKVGGPYQTWLVPPAALPVWEDVDVAVNANIAFMLSCANVMPDGLADYLQEALATDKLGSSYYLGSIPTLYFLARIKSRRYTKLLRPRLNRELRAEISTRTPLMNALLLAASCRAGYESATLQPLVVEILAARRGNHWPAGALYVEPPIDGTAYYAGSSALTTAFVCEALGLYAAQTTAQATVSRRSRAASSFPALRQVQKFTTSLTQPDLQTQYAQAVHAIAERDSDGQISAMAQHFSADLGKKLSKATTQHLDCASINGWLAYTIYDDLLDGEARAVQLGAANLALRQCLEHFRLALPQNRAFQQVVSTTLEIVDGANTWETIQARGSVHKSSIIIDQLPDYGNLAQLAERSWGHMLASTGILIAAGYKLGGPELRAWQQFFHHFLIARQLNDDAHDWQEDLAAGRLSAVVCWLLQGSALPLKLDLSEALTKLRQRFWETTIEEIEPIIMTHLTQAELALNDCTFLKDSRRYQNWLDKLGTAVTQTHNSRQEALAFIDSFTINT